MRAHSITLVILTVFTISFSSCDQGRVLDENREIDKKGWGIGADEEFTFQITDTTSFYNFLINVRNGNAYPYRNLYLFVEMTSPSDKFFADTLEVELADAQGRWKGSGIGNVWMNQVPLIERVRLLESGEYKVRIAQGMRDDTLPSIKDVGLRVELADE